MRESNNAMAPTKAVDDNGDDVNDNDDDGDDYNDDNDNSQSARCVLFDQIEWFLETIVLALPPSATSTTKRNKCSQYYCR